MQLTINGQNITVADQPDRTLLWVLRDELGLTGTKYGCGAGLCGACTVHLNGEPVRSCQTLLSQIQGRAIRTIEGLAELQPNGDLKLHPVQAAFIELQVHQCGWCQSGQMMASAALLARTPNPSEADITTALDGHYCRCATYTRIRAAVHRAAELHGQG